MTRSMFSNILLIAVKRGLLVWSCCSISFSAGYRPTVFGRFRARPVIISEENPRSVGRLSTSVKLSVGDEFSSFESDKSDDASFFQSLNQRAKELSLKTQEISSKWKKGDCKSTAPLAFPDWVRRIAIDYPLVACGSSQETIYLGHLQTGQVIARSTYSTSDDNDSDEETESPPEKDEGDDEPIDTVKLHETIRYMFGRYDGGGTLSIAFEGSLICEGGRRGGVRLWRINPTSNRLVSQGTIPALNGLLATCLQMEEDRFLWVGTHTGKVYAHSLDNPVKPLALQTQPHSVWDTGSSCVLSLQLCSEYSIGAVSLASGMVQLFSTRSTSSKLESGKPKEGTILASIYPPFDGTERRAANVYPTAASFVHTTPDPKDKGAPGLLLVIGGSNGSMYCQKLAMTQNSQGDYEVDTDRPFQQPLQPLGQGHVGGGIIKAMASPFADMLTTIGQDGCLKVWDMKNLVPHYHFAGYKVWAGSLWSDGRFLLSDGVDNSIMMHDFAESEEDVA